MALTEIHSPQPIEYVSNPFYFEYSSTNTGKLNFKYIADVYCSDTSIQSLNPTDKFVGRFKFPIRPDNQDGIFSPASVLKNFVLNNFSADTQDIILNQYPITAYQIKWGEEYDSSLILSAATGTTIYSGLTSDSGLTQNSVKQYDAQAYPNTYPLNNKTLSDWDFANNIKNIHPNQVETLQFIYSGATYLTFMDVIAKDFSGGTAMAFSKPFLSASTGQVRWEIPTGTFNLNITNPDIVNYNIKLKDNSGNTIGLTSGITYNIDYSCGRFEPIRINWLSKFGGYDYFTFPLKHWNTTGRKNAEWERFLNYNYKIGDRGRINLYTEITPKLIVTTDWITDAESLFLYEMFTSSEHNLIKYYADSNTYQPIPLILTTTSFEPQTKLNSVLVQYTFEFEYAQNIWGQRT